MRPIFFGTHVIPERKKLRCPTRCALAHAYTCTILCGWIRFACIYNRQILPACPNISRVIFYRYQRIFLWGKKNDHRVFFRFRTKNVLLYYDVCVFFFSSFPSSYNFLFLFRFSSIASFLNNCEKDRKIYGKDC